MSLIAVTMVKDEADVIGDVIRHLASEGVARIAILDNASSDGTLEAIDRATLEVEKWRSSFPHQCKVTVFDDPEVGYYQSRKITQLLDRITHGPGDWIIPFDADELWHADVPLIEFFAKAEAEWGCSMVEAQLLSHFATDIDPPSPCVFERFTWRDPDVARLPKVAFRWEPGVVVEQGAHGVRFRRARGQSVPGPGVVVRGLSVPGAFCGSALRVRHFPYRSPTQYVRKARNGATAYAATNLPPTTGAHWRRFAALTDEQLRIEYAESYTFADPEVAGQVHDPAPFCRWST